MNARYEITTFESYTAGSRVADHGVITGLSWDDVVARFKKAAVSQHPSETELGAGRSFHYHDHDGKLCRVTRVAVEA